MVLTKTLLFLQYFETRANFYSVNAAEGKRSITLYRFNRFSGIMHMCAFFIIIFELKHLIYYLNLTIFYNFKIIESCVNFIT